MGFTFIYLHKFNLEVKIKRNEQGEENKKPQTTFCQQNIGYGSKKACVYKIIMINNNEVIETYSVGLEGKFPFNRIRRWEPCLKMKKKLKMMTISLHISETLV